MTKNDSIWWLATGSQEHRRQPSFAPATARPSITYSSFGFGWNPESSCFIMSSRHDLLGPPSQSEFACERKVARAMLCFCASKRVRDRFFRSHYWNEDDAEIFAVGHSMFSLQLKENIGTRGHGLSLAEARLSFYSPEGRAQTIHLHTGMTSSFAQRLSGMSALEIYSRT